MFYNFCFTGIADILTIFSKLFASFFVCLNRRGAENAEKEVEKGCLKGGNQR